MCLLPYLSASVKYVTWILLEIPCNFMSQIDCSLFHIHTKFHDYSMLFIQVLFVFHMPKHDMDFTELQVMEFPWHLLRKWWDFHRIWCHFRPNCRQIDVRKSVTHFLQGPEGNPEFSEARKDMNFRKTDKRQNVLWGFSSCGLLF